MITPDDKMTVPIGRVLFWAARCMRRVVVLLKMPPEKISTPTWQTVADAESEFVRTYLVVLKLRAAEVVAYCERIGLRNCTTAMVRDNPFLIALAIDRYLQGGNR